MEPGIPQKHGKAPDYEWSEGSLFFDGETYEPEHDEVRLSGQLARVHTLMIDGRWRTLDEIQVITGDQDQPQSISARLRDLRKRRFGSYVVERRRRGDAAKGLHEYRVLAPGPA